MTLTTDRLGSEQAFHDRQAAARAAHFRDVDSLRFHDDDYLDHETWVRPAFDQLGPLPGVRVLDLGCGHGMASVVLARRGAVVTAVDLSPGYLREARDRAAANRVGVAFVQADGDRLPFAAGSFERVWGNAVLHHLDLATAAREVHRVLAPGGVAVFCEPWGENPLLNLARRVRRTAESHTPHETPLRRRDLLKLRRVFRTVGVRGFQLLAAARRVLPRGRVVAVLDWCDDLLVRRVPFLQQFCRYVVLTLRK